MLQIDTDVTSKPEEGSGQSKNCFKYITLFQPCSHRRTGTFGPGVVGGAVTFLPEKFTHFPNA